MAQLNRQLRVIGVVRRPVGGQRIDPLTGVLVDVPQVVEHETLARRARRATRNEQVEVVSDAIAEDLIDDVDLLAGNRDRQSTATEALRERGHFERQGRRTTRDSQLDWRGAGGGEAKKRRGGQPGAGCYDAP